MMQRRAKIRTAAAAARGEAATVSQRPRIMDLPPPRKTGGLPLISALGAAFDPRIFGSANSKANYVRSLVGRAPYWRDVMVIDLYLAMAGSLDLRA